ncbi:hypothetical protein PJ985_05725 [Streptomyces sp. ACA25]|uniref:DUF6716 putative glycosyltransferase n=1 Tax=Streptomyces sp. ACA25 TaxID=3022596 RepID=UPI0023082924|nr:DUF6716 putative glycosyltransferase [Streptomyces sp. ACA25]MDB1087065.1 hypothetical protein [Streptomyces sp. ACA25]
MPETPTGPLRVAVIADSDTRWKWGALTARRIAPGSVVHGFLLRGRATPTARQLAETGAAPDVLRETTLAGFTAGLADRPSGPEAPGEPGSDGTGRPAFDVVVLACVGGTIQALLHRLGRTWPATGRRPVIVTGYVGVVYEKLTDGLLLRHGADLVLANSRHDAERFRTVYAGAGTDSAAVAECALPFLDSASVAHDPGAVARGERPFRVVFAVQPSVPGSRAEREYLLDRVLAHARRHPDREVVLKLRSRPGEHTTHVEELPYQRLVARTKGDRPANFRLSYGNMGEILDGTDLLVTVSSTAALEALHRSVPTAVLTDLGIREPLGNHYFLGSGCFASWDQLDAGHLPVPDPRWLTDHGVSTAGDRAFAAAGERLAALLDRAATTGLPPLAPFYSPRTAPGYLPGVLARHGLDSKGEPLTAGTGRGAAPRLRAAVRRLVRRAARGAYRTAVQRVAPPIRRWGQL